MVFPSTLPTAKHHYSQCTYLGQSRMPEASLGPKASFCSFANARPLHSKAQKYVTYAHMVFLNYESAPEKITNFSHS